MDVRVARDSDATAILENVRAWPGSAEFFGGKEFSSGECSRCKGTHGKGAKKCNVCGAQFVGESSE